jgi:uncharacterized SAM-binding protein YcdF (DUF218 family)
MRAFWAVLITTGILLVVVALAVGLAMAFGGSLLRVNRPHHADAILVLGGGSDDTRYWRAVDLAKQGYADRIVLDAEAFFGKYGKSNAELAREFLRENHDEHTMVCAVQNDSTYGETEDVARCLAPLNVSSVLIVSWDYHTRRALSIFKARLPHYHWFITGVYTAVPPLPNQILTPDNWWKRRQWAKAILEEWEKLIWWELVDRWRPHLVVQG